MDMAAARKLLSELLTDEDQRIAGLARLVAELLERHDADTADAKQQASVYR
jgi:hypothetical protein